MANRAKYRMLIGSICEDFTRGELSQSISAESISERYSVGKETALRALRILRACAMVEMKSGRLPRFRAPQSRSVEQIASDSKTERRSAADFLAGMIKSRIYDGTYRREYALPKTTRFCRECKVSSHTVARALQMLSNDGLIHKSGMQWVVGSRKESHFSPFYSKILYVIQESPNSFGDLLSHPIWSRFAESFFAEAESRGVELRHVLFDKGSDDGGLIGGMREFGQNVAESADAYAGTLIIPSRRRDKSQHMIEWIHYAAARRTEPVFYLCTSLDWPKIENATRNPRNVALALYGDWKDNFVEYSSTGIAVNILERQGHVNALFIDISSNPKDKEWIESRVMNLRKWAAIQKKVNIHVVLASADILSLPHAQSTAPTASDEAAVLMAALRKYKPTALIAPNDVRARRYYHICRQSGMRIPRDLSLLSFDNMPFIRPLSISSIDFGMHSLGFKTFHGILRDLPVELPGGKIWAKPRINHYGSLTSLSRPGSA